MLRCDVAHTPMAARTGPTRGDADADAIDTRKLPSRRGASPRLHVAVRIVLTLPHPNPCMSSILVVVSNAAQADAASGYVCAGGKGGGAGVGAGGGGGGRGGMCLLVTPDTTPAC